MRVNGLRVEGNEPEHDRATNPVQGSSAADVLEVRGKS
jgi:hypothetical protein